MAHWISMRLEVLRPCHVRFCKAILVVIPLIWIRLLAVRPFHVHWLEGLTLLRLLWRSGLRKSKTSRHGIASVFCFWRNLALGGCRSGIART